MYDPYSGHKDDNGKIFGRGAQDMKSVGMQYLEALRQLINDGHRNFLRNIHLVWGPGTYCFLVPVVSLGLFLINPF